MSSTFTINAESRTDTGKGASRRLRRNGRIPGIIYGAHQEPSMITLAHNELIHQLEDETFYSNLLTLNLGLYLQLAALDLFDHLFCHFALNALLDDHTLSRDMQARLDIFDIHSSDINLSFDQFLAQNIHHLIELELLLGT